MLCEVSLKLTYQEHVLNRLDSLKRKIRDDIDRFLHGGLTVEVLVEARDFVNESMRTHVAKTGESEPVSEFNGPVYSDNGGSDSV